MNLTVPSIDIDFYLAVSPVLLLCLGSIVSLMQSVFPKIGGESATRIFIYITQIGAMIALATIANVGSNAFLFGTYVSGSLTTFGQMLVVAIGLLVTILFQESHHRERFFRGEIVSLFQMVVAGMMILIASEDLITIFVGLELSSIGLYALVGYITPTRQSQEGAIKYFILGAFAAAILLFGFGLLYAATGSMRLSEIVQALPALADNNWVKLGALFTVVGIGFKMALAPFHLWAPDAYEAAPTGITALMATSVKVMILVLALRLFTTGFGQLYEIWMPGMMFLAILSMIVGNIMALVQNNLKRMLAYSSIAHSGYMAIAICAIGGMTGELPVAAILFYLVGYSIISIGAFAILVWLESQNAENLTLDDVSGLGKRHPWAAFSMATFMFAFAGMPPTVGFISKFFVFNAALSSQLYTLVIVGVLGSSISFYYYLRVIVKMFMNESNPLATLIEPKKSHAITAILAVAVILVLLLGTVLPGPTMDAIISTSSDVAMSH